MQSRRAWFVIGIVALGCTGLLLSAIYPIAPATPHADAPSDERFWVADAEQYSMTGQIVVGGERQLAFEELTADSGERYQRIQERNTTTERYQSAPNATIYERLTMDSDANVDDMQEQIASDDTQELLQKDSSDGRVTFIVAKNATDPAVGFSKPAAVVVRSLHVVGYERATDESADIVAFEPQTGWYGDSEGYRVTNTTGEVNVNTDAYTVESASVLWDVTEPANSYTQYVITRLTSSAPTTYEVSFELRSDDSAVDRPTWVPD